MLGRRKIQRDLRSLKFLFIFKDNHGTEQSVHGETISINQFGSTCKLDKSINLGSDQIKIEPLDNSFTTTIKGSVVWQNSSFNSFGIEFSKTTNLPVSYFTGNDSKTSFDRRLSSRRRNTIPALNDRRNTDRRYSELLSITAYPPTNYTRPKFKPLHRGKIEKYSSEAIYQTRSWIEEETKTQFKHIGYFSENPIEFKGKVENPIGVAHVPLGVAGPLQVHGEHAKGLFFIPLATTEGALVTSYNLGSHIITRSGGAYVKIIKDELRIGPVFIFKSMNESQAFLLWMKSNFKKLKAIGERTSNHLKLTDYETILDGRKVNVNFCFETGDAMGMNMACKATEQMCRLIVSVVKPEEYWLRSNFNSNKKVTANGLINGYGKTITAEVTIPRKIMALLNVTPEQMQRYAYRTLQSGVHAGMIGSNGHFANALTAIYIACGQDVALVANSQTGITTCEANSAGDLYMSVYMSSLLLGTVGGGTGFGTAKDCLEMLGCNGTGKSKKFAEIVAATVLAGEITIGASIINGTYILAHESLGRNRP